MTSLDPNDAIGGKCPEIDIPGHNATYEGTVDYPEGKLHYYMYAGVAQPLNVMPLQEWLSKIQQSSPKDNPTNSVDKKLRRQYARGQCRELGGNARDLSAEVLLPQEGINRKTPRS